MVHSKMGGFPHDTQKTKSTKIIMRVDQTNDPRVLEVINYMHLDNTQAKIFTARGLYMKIKKSPTTHHLVSSATRKGEYIDNRFYELQKVLELQKLVIRD